MKYGVSLYSYQTALENGKMTLEDCFRAMKELPGDVNGVEVLMYRKDIPQSSYRGTIREADQAQFRELMAKYDLVPTAYDSTLVNPDYSMDPKNWRLTNPSKDLYDEQMAQLKSEIDFAASFGFKVMRAPNVYGIYEEVIRDSLLYSLDHGIQMCAEIHAPMTIDGYIIKPYLEMVEKTCPEAGGVIPDFGIFARRLPRPGVRNALNAGADPELIERIETVYAARGDIQALAEEIQSKTNDPVVLSFLRKAIFAVNEEPEKLKLVGPYIRHVHAKYYEINEQGVEEGIDFEGGLRVLQELGFEGYLSTEYEGHSFYGDYDPNEAEQVRRQWELVQRLL